MGLIIKDVRLTIPRHPTRKFSVRKNISRLIVHCTAGFQQDPYETARYHISPNHICSKGCPGLCYHDFINDQGIIYHCNDYEVSTWHAGSYNSSSVGIVMAYRGEEMPVPQLQYDALIKHLVVLSLYFKVPPLKDRLMGHREVPGMFTLLGKGSVKFKKWCPGKQVNLDSMRYEVCTRMQRRLAAEALYSDKIDGMFGPNSMKALNLFNPLDNLGSIKKAQVHVGF